MEIGQICGSVAMSPSYPESVTSLQEQTFTSCEASLDLFTLDFGRT